MNYSYDVQGQHHAGRVRRRFIRKKRADEWIAAFANSTPLNVRYSPAKCEDSVLLDADRALSAPAPLHLRSLLLFGLMCSVALAQAPSGDYTASMPSVQRIQTTIQGSDASANDPHSLGRRP